MISIFVLLFIYSLRISTQTSEASEDLLFEDFTNLRGEFIRTVDMSVLNGESLQDNLDDFVAFSKDFYNRKGYAEDVQYSVETVGDAVTVYLNITLSSDDSYLKEGLIINRTLKVFE